MNLPFKILYHHYTIMASPDDTVQCYGIRPVGDWRCRRGSSGSQKKEFSCFDAWWDSDEKRKKSCRESHSTVLEFMIRWDLFFYRLVDPLWRFLKMNNLLESGHLICLNSLTGNLPSRPSWFHSISTWLPYSINQTRNGRAFTVAYLNTSGAFLQ